MRFAAAALALLACGSSTETTERAPGPQVAVPEVAGNGYSALPDDRVEVVASKTGLEVDGQPIVPIRDGKIDASEFEGGTLGIKIVRLSMFASRYLDEAHKKGREPTFALELDPSLPYRMLISTVFSIKQAKTRRFALVARAGGKLVAAPLTLPDKAPPSRSDDRVADLLVIEPAKTIGRGRLGVTKKLVAPASTLTPDVVSAKVMSVYVAGLKRCLGKKPGRHAFEISFGITVEGRTGGVKLTGETGEVADCIGGLIGGWRFPIPKDEEAKPLAVTATLGFELDVEKPADAKPADAKPDPEPAAVMRRPPDDEQDLPIGLFVSITKGELIVWSISRLEGTLTEPRAKIALGPKAMAELSKVLTDIVQRRWGRADRPRVAATKGIVVQADGTVPMQTVAEVIGAVRNGPDGRELFPDVMLSSGFE